MRNVTLVILKSLRIKCHIRRPLRIKRHIRRPLILKFLCWIDLHSCLKSTHYGTDGVLPKH